MTKRLKGVEPDLSSTSIAALQLQDGKPGARGITSDDKTPRAVEHDWDFCFKDSRVKIATKYFPTEDPLLLQILERGNEDAYTNFAGKVYSFSVKDKRPWDLELAPHFDQLRYRRIAVAQERARCRALLVDTLGPIQAVQEEIATAEEKLRRLARHTEGMMNDFLAFVKRAYRTTPHGTVHAILDLDIGRHEVKQMLQLNRLEARTLRLIKLDDHRTTTKDGDEDDGDADDDVGKDDAALAVAGVDDEKNNVEVQALGATSRAPSLGATMSRKSSRLLRSLTGSVFAATQRDLTKSINANNNHEDATATMAEDFMKTRALAQTFTPYHTGSTTTKTKVPSPKADAVMPKEVTPDVKSFLSAAVRAWQLASDLIRDSGSKRTAPRASCMSLCRLIKEEIPADMGLLGEAAMQELSSILPPSAESTATSEGGQLNNVTVRQQKQGDVPVASLEPILEDLSRALEQFLLPIFLVSENFVTFLQKGNKDCLFGGKRQDRQAATTRLSKTNDEEDLDAQGRKRINAEAEEYMDTSVLHGGKQRAKVGTVYPQLLKRLKELQESIFEAEGEIPLLLEHVYLLACGHVQRAWRGYLGRRQAKWLLQWVSRGAGCTCAIEIQRIARGFLQRRRFRVQLAKWKTHRVTTIQSIVRQFLAKRVVANIHQDQWHSIQQTKVESIQKVWRVFRLRQRLEYWGNVRRERLHHLDRDWSATTIQRLFRGHLARTTAANRRLELNIDHDLLKLGEQFMVDGELSAFLRGTNQLLLKNREIMETAHYQEDDRAEMYRGKLQKLREEEAARAWPRYQRAVEVLKKDEEERNALLKRCPAAATDDRHGTMGDDDDVDLVMFKNAMANYGGALEEEYGVKRRPSYLARPPMLNGPSSRVRQFMVDKAEEILRDHGKGVTNKFTRMKWLYLSRKRAVVRQEDQGSQSSKDRGNDSITRQQEVPAVRDPHPSGGHGEVLLDDASALTLRSDGAKAPTMVALTQSLHLEGAHESKALALPSLGAALGKGMMATVRGLTMRTRAMTTSDLSSTSRGKRRKPRGARRLRLLTLTGYQPLQVVATTPRGRHHKQKVNVMNLFTEIPALDLSSGLDERIEKLLRCALIRALVPVNAPPGTTAAQAWDHYASLPPCLSKVQHERKAMMQAHHMAMVMRAQGFRVIRDLLPWEDNVDALRQAGVGPDLQAVCNEIVAGLHEVTLNAKYGAVRTRAKYKALAAEPHHGAGGTACSRAATPEEMHHATCPQVEAESPGRYGDAEQGALMGVPTPALDDRLLCKTISPHGPATHLLAVAMFNVKGPMDSDRHGSLLREILLKEDDEAKRDVLRESVALAMQEVKVLAESLRLSGVVTVADLLGVDLGAWTSNQQLVNEVHRIEAILLADSFSVSNVLPPLQSAWGGASRRTKRTAAGLAPQSSTSTWYSEANRKLRMLRGRRSYWDG